tara:strand:+ start:192 stop:1103 length:912 start_codon:yes stop_codon:yes gene_type:complete
MMSFLDSIDLNKENFQIIKSTFFDIFASEEFNFYYKKLAIEVTNICYGDSKGSCVQVTPTPRIFFSGSHGTSVHCDYWYGHGESVYTIWIPLLNCIPGATFFSDHYNELKYDFKSKDFKIEDLEYLKNKLAKPEFYILPPYDSCYIFNSSTLHGSTINSEILTRLSIDFRISKINDQTSTKDLGNYYHYDTDIKDFKIPLHPFYKKSVLKYICGGLGKNTFAQHVSIDSTAKRYGFILVDQEAEIERYGSPIINNILKEGISLSNKYSGIVISSKNVLSPETINLIEKSKIKVWSALENRFLN